MGVLTTPPIRLTPPSGGFRRAEILFEGVEQAGPSFEARVFLNKPDANEHTLRNPQNGYAGAFHLYGYGKQQPRIDRAHAPIAKRVVATEPLRAALAVSSRLTITVVPIPPQIEVACDQVTVLFDEGQAMTRARR